MNDLTIPVGAAFEKRLAELVWENCPELARQTAAGKNEESFYKIITGRLDAYLASRLADFSTQDLAQFRA